MRNLRGVFLESSHPLLHWPLPPASKGRLTNNSFLKTAATPPASALKGVQEAMWSFVVGDDEPGEALTVDVAEVDEFEFQGFLFR